MENVIDTIAGWPFVIPYVIYVSGVALHISVASRRDYFKHRMVAWALLWPIVTPIWLLSWPACRLLRWRRERMAAKETAEWCEFSRRAMARVMAEDDAEQPGKRADWDADPKTCRPSNALDVRAPFLPPPPKVPYGSRVPEDAKPVTRAEFQELVDMHGRMREREIKNTQRLNELESARAGEGVGPFFEQQLDECKVGIGQDGGVVITGWKKPEPANGLVRWRDGKPRDDWYDQDAERRASS